MSKQYREPFKLRRLIFFIREVFKRGFDIQFLLYRFKWNYFPRLGLTPRFPLHIDIETTDACNLRCKMCVHGQAGVKNVGYIDKDFAEKVIKEAAREGVFSVKFNWRGEPALYKHLSDLIRYAKQCNIREVQLNTNGLPFNKNLIKDIIESGLDRIIFSVDANTEKTYKKIRIGGDFKKLAENIESFIRIRNELGRSKPFIRLQMVRMNLNKDEVNGFIERWKNKVEDLRVSDVTDRGQGSELTVGDQIAVGRQKCPQPWLRFVVNREGIVLPCCSDWHCQWVIGDAKTDSLKNIWKGKKMKDLRKLILENRMNEFEPCKSCFVKESYQWKKNDECAG